MAPKARKASQKKIEAQEAELEIKKAKGGKRAKDTQEPRSSRRTSKRFSEDVQESSTPNISKRKISNITPISEGAKVSASAGSGILKKLKSANPIITEQDVLNSNNNQELVELINALVNSNQDGLFTKFQNKVQAQLDLDHDLVQELNSNLVEKQNTIDRLLNEVNELKTKANFRNNGIGNKLSLSTNSSTVLDINDTIPKDYVYESPIRRKKIKRVDNDASRNSPAPHLINQDQLSKELENIGFTLDMLELLTGLRIINFQEDETRYYFDVKQTSTSSSASAVRDSLFINYRLVIAKSFESTAEINYIPTFLEALEDDFEQDEDDSSSEVDLEENAKFLKKILPEYLCENLSFPYNTLSQFYGKVSRALNKKVRHD